MFYKKQIPIMLLFIILFSQINLFETNSNFSEKFDTAFSDNLIYSKSNSFAKPDDISSSDITYNKTWTYMLYLDADNDIEADAIRDFEWLEDAGGSDENISIVVLLDRIPGYDNTHGNWDGSRIYNITEDVTSITIDSQLMVDLGEVNMASTTTLTNFITYCFDNFPAENYILDLWNHGHAAYGVIDDETSGSHFVVNEIQTAINDAYAISNETIDIISMDACNMATIEVAWEFRNLCQYFIASETGTNGYPYNRIIERLKQDPSMNPSSLCDLMVDAYYRYYRSQYIACLSVINQTKLLDLPTLFNSFVSELMTSLDSSSSKRMFIFAREQSLEFYDSCWVDLVTLIENIILFLDNPNLVLLGEELLDFLDQLICYNWQHDIYKENANGVTIFMPYVSAIDEFIDPYIQRISYCYEMDWQLATLWDEFLEFYADNNINFITVEPVILSSGEPITGCSISQNATQLYQVNYWKDSIYEFTCSISSGDLDFKVYNYDYSGCFELIGGSYLVNPSDGSIEKCRFRLENGCYLIIVKGKTSMTEYSIETKECEAINLVCNSPQTDSGGSINGDSQDHFKQDLYFYFKIDIPYGNNTIQLTSSETTNYQMTIYNVAWYFRYNLSTTSYGEVLTLLYNNTDESPITLYFEISCLEGSGSFTIEVKNPLEPTPKVKLPFLIFFAFLPIIAVISRRKGNH